MHFIKKYSDNPFSVLQAYEIQKAVCFAAAEINIKGI